MNYLLDTHALIWFLNGDNQPSDEAKQAIENSTNLKLVSIASIWEIAIKISLGKIIFDNGFNNFLKLIEDNGFELIPISFEHAIAVSTLEFIHRDLFDRLIVSQAIVDGLTIITRDEHIGKYRTKILW